VRGLCRKGRIVMRAGKEERDVNTYAIQGSGTRLKDVPERLRPREIIEQLGLRGAPDDVLLAVVLRSGVPGMNVLELARSLLVNYGSLSELARVSMDELMGRRGIGRVKALVLKASLELATRLGEESIGHAKPIRKPEDAARILRSRAAACEGEVFWILLLDTKNRLRRPPVEVTRGLLDASLVHPREIFREAVRSSSAAVILAHNHPSGDPSPSEEDIAITKRLIRAGRIVDIQVLDHIILGRSMREGMPDFMSLRTTGLVSFEDDAV